MSACLSGVAGARVLARLAAALLLVVLWASAGVPRAAAQTDPLIRAGADWRYNDTGKDLGTGWREPGYDDSAWERGKAPLGYGVDSLNTKLSYGGDPERKHPTYYFRTAFTVANPAILPTMLLKIRYDDGFIAYLNGREVLRSGFPGGLAVKYDTLADQHIDKGQRLLYETFNLANQHSLFVAGKNVLAIEVHQHTLNSSDLVLDVSLEPVTNLAAPQFTLGPALGQVRPASIHVLVGSDVPVTAIVQYGSTAALGTEQKISAQLAQHDIIIAGLKPGSTYYYRVGIAAAQGQDPTWSETRSFTTAPVPEASFRFGVWSGGPEAGDNSALRPVFEKLHAGEPLGLAVALGRSANASPSRNLVGVYSQYYGAIEPLVGSVPLYSTLPASVTGDCEGCLAAFQSYLPNPSANDGRYYSFDYGSAHFVMLDVFDQAGTAQAGLGAEQWNWLTNDLATKTSPNTFVFMSRSLFDAPNQAAFTEAQRGSLHQLFKSANVTAVFSGADAYSYQERDGLPYVSVGALPGTTGQLADQVVLVDVQPAAVQLTALAVNARTKVDERRLAERPGMAPAPTPVPAPGSDAVPAPAPSSGAPSMIVMILLFAIGLAGGAAIGWTYWLRTYW